MPRSYERGEVIFREGDGGDTCYVIRTGAVASPAATTTAAR